MTAAKKIFAAVIAALILNFFATANAQDEKPYFGEWSPEEIERINNLLSKSYDPPKIDTYFTWKIENPDDYAQYNDLFKKFSQNAAADIRAQIYEQIIAEKYFEAAMLCRFAEIYQKLTFGADYFDADLIELTAKLYLAADELDAAERKINFLQDNASTDAFKIRALILKADLLNRRENFNDALQATHAADQLLTTLPDNNLSLLNQAQAAKAYCGLGDFTKAATVSDQIYRPMETAFGQDSAATFSLMSTVAKIRRNANDYEAAEKILKLKEERATDRNKKTEAYSFAVADSKIELADFYFKIGDAEEGEDILEDAIFFIDINGTELGMFSLRRLYTNINRIAVKHLKKNHEIVLTSEVGVIQSSSMSVDALQSSVDLYKKNLSKVKKIFGEDNIDTFNFMGVLIENCLLLGNYSDAQKIAEERLHLCQKHIGADMPYTVSCAIKLADIYYQMGKYKTADNLLANLEAQNPDLFKGDEPDYEFACDLLFAKACGARLRGNIIDYSDCLQKIAALVEKNNSDSSNTWTDTNFMRMLLEAYKFFAMTEFVYNNADFENWIVNFSGTMGANYRPEILKMMNDVAESHIKYGDLNEATRYANQILRMSKSTTGNVCEWMALSTLAKVRRAEDKFTDALNLDSQALQIAETVCGKNSLERLQSLDALATDKANIGDLAEAIKIREDALAEYKKILEDTDTATVQMMTNLAESYVAAERYAVAINLCDETLAMQKVPIYKDDHLNFFPAVTEPIRIKADAQRLSGDYADAYMNYKNLIQVFESKRLIGKTVNNIYAFSATAENKSKWFANFVPVYKNAATVAAIVGDNDFAFYCMEFCKGRNLLDQFDDVLATKNYLLTTEEKNSLACHQKILDDCRNLSAFAAANNDETMLGDIDIFQNSIHMTLESFKGQLRQKYSDNMIPKDAQNQADKNFNLNGVNQANVWDWNEILKNFDVRKNQAAIPGDACLIEFMKTADDSLLVTFLRNEGNVQAANISVDKNFFERCRLYHGLNSYPNLKAMNRDGKYLWNDNGDYVIADTREYDYYHPEAFSIKDEAKFNELRQKLAAELSDKLMPTLEKFAGNSRHWIISPDADLNLLPFETLNYREKFLVQSKNISYVPSLAVMNLMKNRERKNSYLSRSKELFAMGNAVYNSDDSTASRQNRKDFFDKMRGNTDKKIDLTALQWDNLDGTALELDKVSPFFESKTIFRREQVTEKNLRELNASGELAKYKYLLFSTHGIFVPQKPELSSIVLSQGLGDEDFDGYVTVGEWMGYDLRSNLIYLSACESGLGGYRAGEGIIGIPYALTVAGNKDTVMSLWQVDDTATAEFTAAVFEKLSRGQSEVQALNETKREFLSSDDADLNDPAVWAAFVLYGI